MRSSREIQEEINELGIKAKAIVQVCKKDKRQLTDDEKKEFDDLTKERIPKLKKELASSIEMENAIREISDEQSRDEIVQNIDEELERTKGGGLQMHHMGKHPDDVSRRREQKHFYRLGKLKAFRTEEDAFDSGMWMKALVARSYGRVDVAAEKHCHKKGWDVEAAGNEGSGSAGGYVVPSPMSTAIIDVRERVGIVRNLARLIPMTSNTLDMAKRAGGLTVYDPGETQTIQTSDKTWNRIELVARKRAVAHQISQELQEDSLIGIVDDAISEFGTALALQEDEELINGDGTSQYFLVQGLLNRLGAGGVFTADTGKSTWALQTLAEATATMAKLPDEYHMNPAWICSSAFYYNVMLRLEAAAGGNTIVSLQEGEQGRRMFLGYPVFTTNRMPTTTAVSQVSALFGSFDMGVILGERTGVMIGRSTDYAFLNDLLTLKATVRYDINVHSPGTASAAGAYVGWKTAAS